MASFSEQSDLVVQQVQNLAGIAGNAYVTANRMLEDLALSANSLPFSLINPDIGDTATISWGAVDTVTFPTLPAIPEEDWTPPADITIDDVAAVTIVVPEQPTLAAGTVTPPEDYTVNTVTFPTAPTFPVFDESYLTFNITPPTISEALTELEYNYLEPTYTQSILDTVITTLNSVLGGGIIIPSSYWTTLWESSANDLTRQQNARLRTARNRGAASFWPLPSETVTAASADIQDETARAVQVNRLEQAKEQVRTAREDLWNAVEKGISAEALIIGMFEAMAGRALAAAEQLLNMKIQKNNQTIQLYQADIQQYAAEAQAKTSIATAYSASYKSQVDALAAVYKAEIDGAIGEIEFEKSKIQAWIAQWEGYKIEGDVRIREMEAKVQLWTSAVDNTVKYEGVKVQKGGLDVNYYTAQMGRIEAMARVVSSLSGAWVANANAQTQYAGLKVELDRAKNDIETRLTQLTQLAQEAQARLEIEQAQWLQGQGISIQQRMAELSFGYAQAAIAASDVSLASQVGMSLDDNSNRQYNWDMNEQGTYVPPGLG